MTCPRSQEPPNYQIQFPDSGLLCPLLQLPAVRRLRKVCFYDGSLYVSVFCITTKEQIRTSNSNCQRNQTVAFFPNEINI